MIDALPAALATNLGLLPSDLAEIGGFGRKTATDILSGKMRCPADVYDAMLDIQEDIDVMVDEIEATVQEGTGAIFVWRTTDELRHHFPQWPGRGRAAGGFTGPHRIASLTAWEALRDQGIEVDLLFFEPE